MLDRSLTLMRSSKKSLSTGSLQNGHIEGFGFGGSVISSGNAISSIWSLAYGTSKSSGIEVRRGGDVVVASTDVEGSGGASTDEGGILRCRSDTPSLSTTKLALS